MRINVIGSELAAGAGLALFDGPFVVGAPLSVLSLGKPSMSGLVHAVDDGRALIEIDGRCWWAKAAPQRPQPHAAPMTPELWEVDEPL
jgi:hypothetical protein